MGYGESKTVNIDVNNAKENNNNIINKYKNGRKWKQVYVKLIHILQKYKCKH